MSAGCRGDGEVAGEAVRRGGQWSTSRGIAVSVAAAGVDDPREEDDETETDAEGQDTTGVTGGVRRRVFAGSGRESVGRQEQHQ